MKDLTNLVTSEELERFGEIFESVKNEKNISLEERNKSFLIKINEWIKSLNNSELLINSITGEQWKSIRKAYEKIIEPYVKKRIKFVPILGTLLGLYRDGKLIEYDDDLDIAVDVVEYNKISKKIRTKAFFHGWTSVEMGWFRDGYNHSQTKSKLIQFYSMKNIKFKLGEFTFETKSQFDIWPLIKEPLKETRIDDRNLYQIHIYNLLTKNNEVYSSKNYIVNRLDENFKGYANKIIDDPDSKEISVLWIEELWERSKKSNSNYYMPLERDMFKIDSFEIGKNICIDKLNIYWPNVSDSFFEKNYGDWKTPKFSHLHSIKFNTIKKS